MLCLAARIMFSLSSILSRYVIFFTCVVNFVLYLFLNCLFRSSVLLVKSWRIFSLNNPVFWALFFKFALLIGNFPNSIFKELLGQPSRFCIWCYDFASSDSKFHFFSEKTSNKCPLISGLFFPISWMLFMMLGYFFSESSIIYIKMMYTKHSL